MKVENDTVTNSIAAAIRHDIDFSILKPGTKLIEREIAEKYNASHIPVREAFRILEGDNYVDHTSFTGYIVREYSPEDMMEFLEILRFLVETLISKAIPRYSQITYYQFESILEEMSKTKDNDQLIHLYNRFNETAYAPAGLDFSFTLTMKIYRRNIRYLQELLNDSSTRDYAVSIRRKFIAACQTKGPEAGLKIWMDSFNDLAKKMTVLLSKKKLPEKHNK